MAITRRNTLVLVVALALAACAAPEGADGTSGTPEAAAGEKIVTKYNKLYDVRIEEGRRTRRHVGWVEHRHPVDEPTGGKYFVLDVERTRVGFVLPLGGAYRYQMKDGELVGTESLGPGGLSGGIARVLGIQTDQLEFAPIGDPPAAPGDE